MKDRKKLIIIIVAVWISLLIFAFSTKSFAQKDPELRIMELRGIDGTTITLLTDTTSSNIKNWWWMRNTLIGEVKDIIPGTSNKLEFFPTENGNYSITGWRKDGTRIRSNTITFIKKKTSKIKK